MGSKECLKRQRWFSCRLLGPADSYPHTLYVCDLKGTPSRENKEYFADVQVFFVRTKACAQCSVQICGVYWARLIGSTCCQFHALRTGFWAKKGGRQILNMGKDTVNQKRSAPSICICVRVKGHTGLLKVLLLLGLRGPHKHSSSYENKLEAIRLLHSFAIKVLVLSPLWTAVSFILALPAWLGEINQTKKSL